MDALIRYSVRVAVLLGHALVSTLVHHHLQFFKSIESGGTVWTQNLETPALIGSFHIKREVAKPPWTG